MADILRMSIGSRIGRAVVQCCTKEELSIVSKIIEGVKMRGLHVAVYAITNDIRSVSKLFVLMIHPKISDFLLTEIDAGFLSVCVTELVVTDPG